MVNKSTSEKHMDLKSGLLVTFILGALKGDRGLSNLSEAFYYSLATYSGVGDPKSNPTRFKWTIFFHRLVGVFACAYITAVFIITII